MPACARVRRQLIDRTEWLLILDSEVEDAIPHSPGSRTFQMNTEPNSIEAEMQTEPKSPRLVTGHYFAVNFCCL